MGFFSRFKSKVRNIVSKVKSVVRKSVVRSSQKTAAAKNITVRIVRKSVVTSTKKVSSAKAASVVRVTGTVRATKAKTSSAGSRASTTVTARTGSLKDVLKAVDDAVKDVASSSVRDASEMAIEAKDRFKLTTDAEFQAAREVRNKIREALGEDPIDEVKPEPEKPLTITQALRKSVTALKDLPGILLNVGRIPSKILEKIRERNQKFIDDNLESPAMKIEDEINQEAPQALDWLESRGFQVRRKSPAFPVAIVMGVVGFLSFVVFPLVTWIRRKVWKIWPTVIPGTSDLVRMELREVFRDDERLEQLDPPPSETFIKFMREQGFDRFHSESFWAAHWELPGVQVAFEMFHRLRPGVVSKELQFTREDLKKLLKRLDVLPQFHDQLIAIAFRPLTRVDVRRMWRIGIFRDKSELTSAYLNLGFSPEDAGRMTEFTVKFLEPEDRALTKSDTLKAYIEDILTEDQTIDALESIGFDTADIEILLNIASERKLKATRDDEEGKLPSKSELDAMFRLEIVNEEKYTELLKKVGFKGDILELVVKLEKAQKKT